MLFKTVALLALAAHCFARAHPKRQGYYHPHFSGSGEMGFPTGHPWGPDRPGQGWSAWFSGKPPAPASTTANLPSVQAIPQTAVPPTSSPAEAASTPSSNCAVVNNVQTANAFSGSSCSSTSTTTTTEWVTSTVLPVPGGGSPTVSSSDSVNLIAASSVSPAGFYQHPTFSYSGAASSWPASVPTTFATSAVGSSPASSATIPSSTGGATGGKRGLSYNDASLTDAFAGKGMTWAYNWGSSPGGTILSGLEYVPMLWGLASTSGWASAAKAAIAAGSTHLFSFNEPDLSSQANIDPQSAATAHQSNMNQFAGNGVQISSPAITNGAGTNPPMGIDWLNQFFTACAGKCKVDFVTFHWYAPASQIAYFKQHVQDVINAAAAHGVSKVWLTEFQASGSDSEVEAFLAEALPFLDSTPAVERYAYFMCATGAGNLVSGNGLSAIGNSYA